jgi:hypothetical protein
MIDPILDLEKRRYLALRETLLREDPEIDERTLADTVEGISNYPDMLAEIVRGALYDEMMVDAIKARIAGMAARLDRFETRAAKRRQIVRDSMVETGLDKLVQPDFSASLRRSSPAVQVIDATLIPQTFWEPRPHLRRAELLTALKDGAEIPGATLSNPFLSLSVRTK